MSKPHVGRQQLYWELQCRRSRGNFPKRLEQYPQLFLLANLSITIKSNQFVKKKVQGVWIFEGTKKTKRANSHLTHFSQKTKKWVKNTLKCF